MVSSDELSTYPLLSTYDVIIAGGGTAGIALATRLSEEPQLQVLVLEAGGSHDNDPTVLTPGLARMLSGNSKYDWGFQSVPQEALGQRKITQNRGKGLGGSSLINRNMMTFPSAASLDAWHDLGNPGWDFKSMEPYYRKFHTFHEPSEEVSDALKLDYMEPRLHGKSGPVHITFGEYQSQFEKAWSETFQNLGYKAKADPISGLTVGGHNAPSTIDHETMTRSHSAVAYITPAVLQRPNLHIITDAIVESIIFQRDGTATAQTQGVRFSTKSGERSEVLGTEVIICAGAIQSPQILELSGIGSHSLLKKYGIDTIVENPHVGENLQDHAIIGASFESMVPTFDSFRDPKLAGAAIAEYEAKKSGPMAFATYCAAFMPCMKLLQDDTQLRQLLDHHLEDKPLLFPGQEAQYNLIRKVLEDPKQSSVQYLLAPAQLADYQSPAEVTAAARQHDYITLLASLSHPFSRGNVHINSADPISKPTMDPKYFSHPLDSELITFHLQYLETIAATEPLKSLLKPDGLRIPSNFNSATKSFEETKSFVEYGFSTFHPCGTCAMMPQKLGGVVDERLRVYGVKNLRIVDASIFPLIPRGNIVSSVYAVAEKAADLIKEDFGLVLSPEYRAQV